MGTALSLAHSVAPEVQTMGTCNLSLSPDRDGPVCQLLATIEMLVTDYNDFTDCH